MDMAGKWKGPAALVVGVFVLVGQSFIGYVTENGQLPPWMPEKLSGLASWLSSEISIPHWSLVLILACIAGAGTLFVRFQSRTARMQRVFLFDMETELADAKERYSTLEAVNATLRQESLEKPQAEVELPKIAFRALKVIAMLTDENITSMLPLICSGIGAGNVETHAAVDTLIERGLLSKSASSRGVIYRLTSNGRAYFLKHKG